MKKDNLVRVYTVEEVEQNFGCKLKTKHGILPMTELPNSNLVAESVLLLVKYGTILLMSSAVIVSSKEKLAENEENAIDYLIREADNAPICDDDEEGWEILAFFTNFCVSVVSPNQRNSAYEYIGLKSQNGRSFNLIKDNVNFGEIYDSDQNMFCCKVFSSDVLNR